MVQSTPGSGIATHPPTRDVDMLLHIETGAAAFGAVRLELERLGYALLEPVGCKISTTRRG